MRVYRLSYNSYRNLKDDTLEMSEKINVIYGENAQGKTNLLEAIWLMTGARSFRGTKDKDLVRFGEKKAQVDCKVSFNNQEESIKISISDGKREAEINGIKRGPASSIIGFFKAVIFSPEHLMLIKGGPENRRKFIDAAICQVKPTYPNLLLKYAKTLKHRNFLLKAIQSHKNLEDTLDIWDEKLSDYAGFIIAERIKYSEEFSDFAKEFYLKISGKEDFSISYSRLNQFINMNPNQISKCILEELKMSRKQDLFRRTTNVGPHRDEFEIKIDSKSAKQLASQGQQRTGIIAMKLSEATMIEKLSNQHPVILLDDILSELDQNRQEKMFNLVSKAQIFITGCQKLDLSGSIKKILVKSGNVFA